VAAALAVAGFHTFTLRENGLPISSLDPEG